MQIREPVPGDVLYDNYVTLSSWKAQPHVPRVLQMLKSLPGISHDARVVEIGSNDGSFLSAMRSDGFKDLLGIEPAADAVNAARKNGIETEHAFLTPALAAALRASRGPFDLVVSRQMLEHVEDLRGVREAIALLLRPGGHVFIEVPDFGFVVDNADYSAVWEEHVNYFTSAAMRRYLAPAAIDIVMEETVSFSGQALMVAGTLRSSAGRESARDAPRGAAGATGYAADAAPDEAELDRVRRFGGEWLQFRDTLRDEVRARRRDDGNVAVYGAGCRACQLINLTGIGADIAYVVDDQLEKQRRWLPGSRLRIAPTSELLAAGKGSCLLAVNAENEDAVIARLRSGPVGFRGRLASILPPSPRLLSSWLRSARPVAR